MNFFQSTLQAVEVGKAQLLARLIPLVAAVLFIGGTYDRVIFHGLSDAQSMDNAQLARQIARHEGFHTEFLRPQAIAQLRDFALKQSAVTGKSHELYPANEFRPGVMKYLPDTYNPPGYPCLLAGWFYLIRPDFTQLPKFISVNRIFSGDQSIPLLNQIFLLLTAILVFGLGQRFFDERVAWLSMLAFFSTELVWHYSLTALSTSLLMFLVTALLMCAVEVYCVGEACFKDEGRSFVPAWLWTLAVALLLGVACLTRLHLLVLLIPLAVLWGVMPRSNFFLTFFLVLVVVGLVVPWFIHEKKISGSFLGSNAPLLLYGQDGYADNQIFCSEVIPNYEQLFGEAGKKETSGFRWHLEHAWTLLGSNPFILFFGASIFHVFKRQRNRALHWLLLGCALLLIAANNLGSANPDTVDTWNVLVILFPGMLVLGTAFFFVLIDRMNIQIKLLSNILVIAMLGITAVPLALTLSGNAAPYATYPPYVPSVIRTIAQFAQPDEWVTSDMPWATAWYGDRASLWIPDSLKDFENLNDDVCPTGVLFFTPVSWSKPISTFSTGEYKDWWPFVAGLSTPVDFPLLAHLKLPPPPTGYDYDMWSDRARWQAR